MTMKNDTQISNYGEEMTNAVASVTTLIEPSTVEIPAKKPVANLLLTYWTHVGNRVRSLCGYKSPQGSNLPIAGVALDEASTMADAVQADEFNPDDILIEGTPGSQTTVPESNTTSAVATKNGAPEAAKIEAAEISMDELFGDDFALDALASLALMSAAGTDADDTSDVS